MSFPSPVFGGGDRGGGRTLQTIEERHQGRAVLRAKALEALLRRNRLAAMRHDRLRQRGSASVVQVEDTPRKAPERCGAELVPFRRPLLNSVRKLRSHIVQQQIGV